VRGEGAPELVEGADEGRPSPGASHHPLPHAGQGTEQLQTRQLFVRVILRVDFRVRLRDPAVLVDQIRDAARVFILRALGRAVGDADRAIRVGDQRERELVFCGERGVVGRLVEADADDLRVLLFVFRGEVPEPGTLCLSAGCVGFRIEPEHDLAPAQIAQPQRTSNLIGRIEIGCGITDFEHVSLSCEQPEQSAQRHGWILIEG
jgi:hypothetical protein